MKKDEFETIANSQQRPDRQSSQQFGGTQEKLVTDQSHQTANPPDRLLSGDSDSLDTVPLQQRSWLLPGILGAGIVAIAAIAVGTRFLPQGETPSSNPASVTTPSPANPSESNVPPAASSQEKMLLAQAKLLADGGEAKQLAQAIEIAQQIPKTASEYPQAQTLIATWSEQILQQANTQASQGDLSKAIAIAQSIPVDTKAHPKAQQQITTWNQSLSNQRKTIQPPAPIATKAVPEIDPQQQKELTRIRATEAQQQRELASLREIEAQKQRELTRIRATEAQQQRELARLRDTEAQQQQQLAGIQTSKTPTQKSFDSLRRIESQQQGELARLAEAEAQQQQELARLRAAEAEQQQELARLEASEAQKQQELQRLRNEARQQQELARLQTNQTQTQPPPSNPSNLSSDDPSLNEDPYLNIDIPKVQPQSRAVSPPAQPAQIASSPVLTNSYGFSNITVKGATVAIELRDNVDEDGDYVTLRVNGKVYANNQLILNRGTVIRVDLQPGENQVDIVGVKDGRGGITLEVNIAGVGNVNRRPIPEGRTASFIINRE